MKNDTWVEGILQYDPEFFCPVLDGLKFSAALSTPFLIPLFFFELCPGDIGEEIFIPRESRKTEVRLFLRTRFMKFIQDIISQDLGGFCCPRYFSHLSFKSLPSESHVIILRSDRRVFYVAKTRTARVLYKAAKHAMKLARALLIVG